MRREKICKNQLLPCGRKISDKGRLPCGVYICPLLEKMEPGTIIYGYPEGREQCGWIARFFNWLFEPKEVEGVIFDEHGDPHVDPDSCSPLPECKPPKEEGMRLHCNSCGKSVSTVVPENTVVRAWIQCPECIEIENKSDEE